jgi:hypothetical protein
MAQHKFKKHQSESIITTSIKARIIKKDIDTDGLFLFSLKHLDATQGDSLGAWEKQTILARCLDTLKGYCSQSLKSQFDKKFTVYGDFPPEAKTEFSHPKHVPEDANWARIHVTGQQVVVGHIVKNIFFIVFLDGLHEFWLTSKK